MLHRDVVNQLKNQHGLPDARAPEQTNLSTLYIRLHQVDDLDAGLKHFQACGLIFQRWRRAMDRIMRRTVDGAQLIDRFAQHVHHSSQRRTAHGNGDALAQIFRGHAANHAFDGFHGHGADAPFAQMLLHFGGHVQWFGNVESLAGDAHRVVDRRKVPRFKLDIQHRADDLHDSSHAFAFFRHAFS